MSDENEIHAAARRLCEDLVALGWARTFEEAAAEVARQLAADGVVPNGADR